MEEQDFHDNFPAFPSSDGNIQRIGVVLRNKKLLTKEEFDHLKEKHN